MARIAFAAGEAAMPEAARKLLERALAELKRDEAARLQLLAFAGSSAGSDARRLSLSRALAVRAFLVEQGVRSTRIDVRALGERESDQPPDRVDVMLVRR